VRPRPSFLLSIFGTDVCIDLGIDLGGVGGGILWGRLWGRPANSYCMAMGGSIGILQVANAHHVWLPYVIISSWYIATLLGLSSAGTSAHSSANPTLTAGPPGGKHRENNG